MINFVKSKFDYHEQDINTYIEVNVIFKTKNLDHLQKATSLVVIRPFFENFLPTVFGMKTIPKQSKSIKKRNKLAEDGLALLWVKKCEQIKTLYHLSISENIS